MINVDKMTPEELIRYTQLDDAATARELELTLRLADALDEISALEEELRAQRHLTFVD